MSSSSSSSSDSEGSVNESLFDFDDAEQGFVEEVATASAREPERQQS